MEYIWSLIILIIAFRIIQRLAERSRTGDRFGDLRNRPQAGRAKLHFRRTTDGQYRLKLPEYWTGRRGKPAAGYDVSAGKDLWPVTGGAASTVEKQRRIMERVAGNMTEEFPESCPLLEAEGAKGHEAGSGKRYGRNDRDLLEDMICPDGLVRGVIWSEILGPRRGLSRRRGSCQS